VDDVSFEVGAGETLAVVGESGSGKTVAALSMLRLISPPGRIVGGAILYKGRDLLTASSSEIQAIRGGEISMIFQEPMSSLNPVFTCGEQIVETLIVHERLSRRAARVRAIEMLELVGISAPDQRVDEYPHQLSGGMRQRVMIAMALACRPSILIADEPTTALDVTIQAQILELLKRLQQELGMAVVLITHDLGVVAETANRVAVMYAGQVVEYCGVREAFSRPFHPYTAGLQASLPKLGVRQHTLRDFIPAAPSPCPAVSRIPSSWRSRQATSRAVFGRRKSRAASSTLRRPQKRDERTNPRGPRSQEALSDQEGAVFENRRPRQGGGRRLVHGVAG
jgi:peptide/nickel transport system ATP-binding protein/oligopeptide transport system ATP-binding protein